MSWIGVTAHHSYFITLKNWLALLLPPRRGWKVKATAWFSDPHKSFKLSALPLPSFLPLKQQAGFPSFSPIAPHPSLSPLFSSSCSSGRSNPGSIKTRTVFLEQHIKFCQHCWKLLCYIWENEMSSEPWLTPLQHSTEYCPNLRVYSNPSVFKQIS